MENKMDIFDMLENIESNIEETNYITHSFVYETKNSKENIEYNKNSNFNYKVKKEIKAISFIIGFIKYIATSTLIFTVLLLTANYSAYIDVAKSYIYADELKQESISLLNSVEASKITPKSPKLSESSKQKEINKNASEKIRKSKKSKYSIKKLVNETNKKRPKLDIEITPYENRIIIPKIAKNIPLLDIKQKSVD
jgi:hypothetical protein